MSTDKQKAAARRNLQKARAAQSARARGKHVPRRSTHSGDGLSTAQTNDLPASAFAFPSQRKEPLIDATHVRNAVARFDQVAGVSDADRDKAWRRVRVAARRFGVEISARGWRELVEGGRAKPR